MKHTPTPWKTNTAIHPDDQVFSADGAIVADCKWTKHNPDIRSANAEHIVRCVNAHDDLAAALEELLAERANDFHHDTEGFNMARAALAKARP